MGMKSKSSHFLIFHRGDQKKGEEFDAFFPNCLCISRCTRVDPGASLCDAFHRQIADTFFVSQPKNTNQNG